MALRALMLRRRIADANARLEAERARNAEFEQRERDLETSINEATTEEERSAVDEAITAFENERDEHNRTVEILEDEVRQLEEELAEAESQQEAPAANPAPAENAGNEERMVNRMVPQNLRFAEMNFEQRTAIVEREEVREFLTRVRTLGGQQRAVSNADLLIPDILLGLLRHEVAHRSRLLPYVRTVNVGGTARQNIAGAIPEGVWTEMCANLNELNLSFNQVAIDGYKVGGYIAICNATLEDSDINLTSEIVTAISGAIAKALDKAILFGTGTKMPVGICTRLAQTAQPSSWGANAPAWTDLHTSNVLKLNIDTTSGAAFFTALIEALAVAKPWYSNEGLFWVMNRKTHLHIMAKALAFTKDATLTFNTSLMPIIGGTVIEFEDEEIADNEIIGGYGGNYLLAQRAGVAIQGSDIPLFLQDQTVYKGTARYDGLPVAGEGFVALRFDNTAPTVTATFATDTANS